MASRKRTLFTDDQRKELQSAIDNGLTSVGAKHIEAIEDLAKRVNCSTQMVKVQL